MSDPAAALQEWHDAVNAGDVDAAVACCTEDVAIAGPRGIGHGHDLVRGWLTRSGIRLEPQEPLVEADGRFVVREVARWTTAGAPQGAPLEPTETWCVFTVTDGKVASIARFESPADIPAPANG
ncbi:nuclear transport factor 2 family protein [Nocardioides sp. WL0053]|jgi:ketosteroid isomerase-like protein|uniref:Nuclear transport factor 2 family protein n=1 Tax=Nocardioides jiangsuensis TaxID=2866161 RepID=A0ABS7RIK4_9ACTN|nr:nuclear transport factor 2 family protein [Nocardioides jiangsuensis]MBY9074869.1 nuclear transport factor 2 family protein [Nocardioides jiangsuensis]